MIGFIDTEISKNKVVSDIGCIKENGEILHTKSIQELIKFTKKVDFFCGHNFVSHDFIHLNRILPRKFIPLETTIDTLYLSALLFPERPYHHLVKNDKLDSDSLNNPLNDARNAQILFMDEVDAFNRLDDTLKQIYYSILKDEPGFSGFFKHMKYNPKVRNLVELIQLYFGDKVCHNIDINALLKEVRVELAYCLSLITTSEADSLMPGWVLMNYPKVEPLMIKLRSTPCRQGCDYCNTHLDAKHALKRFFGYEDFRKYNDLPLQEQAVKSAIKNESLIAVFPTGGGKSLTYQLPALLSRENTRGLTVVISPLQSLMKDQVDNLEDNSIVSAVAISGLLDPIQRKEAIERVESGLAGILYIAPESLRSKTIERLLIKRHVTRFVIDEAHCFSSWGHDFRVDYLYIGKFIKHIQEVKGNKTSIPVSCFTATAKKNVIEDISNYFKEHLNLDMKIYQTSSRRTNLAYKVIDVTDDEEKYQKLRSIIEQENCPTIIYASRTKIVDSLYERMKKDHFSVSRFHGSMEKDAKVEEQDKFMKGINPIMIATSAFGMGVDKKDIGCVIHYQISSSLEDYVQESGRAGRDEHIHAQCYILYNEQDLNGHFELLNRSKLNLKEIQQIWKAVKELTKVRESISQSALEIARIAGWDESIHDLETRVTTAVATLEETGYLLRGQNSPRVFANSIMAKTMADAAKKIDESELIPETEKSLTKRIIKLLISSQSKNKGADGEAESRVDYIAENLGVEKHLVLKSINHLREIQLLADHKDLSAFLKRTKGSSTVQKSLDNQVELIQYILSVLSPDQKFYNLKDLNDHALNSGIDSNLKQVRGIINYFAIKKWIDLKKNGKDNVSIEFNQKPEYIKELIQKNAAISSIIINYLYRLMSEQKSNTEFSTVVFSVLELKQFYDNSKGMLDYNVNLDDIEDALFFMQRSGIITIEGGFMVIYSPLYIERIEKNPHKQFTKTDYEQLDSFYQSRREQVHIVGEYASKMIKNYQEALLFVDDYFQYEFNEFLGKYFKGDRKKDIERSMTPAKFKELFGSLSPEQLAVIKDKDHNRIVVAAGPGSGKTKLLVHKLASILYTEDIRTEQLMMLTFSRASVGEFKDRLYKLIGEASYFVDIMTFHSFCFDILGRVGSIDKTEGIVQSAVENIRSGDVDPSKITKMVLVIDEAQDMDQNEYDLINEIIEFNENIRIIAVGDDDQNIYEFRGSNSKYFKELMTDDGAFYELSTNYRSKNNLVTFTNQFVNFIPNRIKNNPIVAYTKDNGRIEVIRHRTSENLIVGIVEQVMLENPPGRTCIITWKNEQALHALGILNLKGISANLIQNNERLKVFSLYEIRVFMSFFSNDIHEGMVSNDTWKNAVIRFDDIFKDTSNYKMCIRIMRAFRNEYKTAFYYSDLESFIFETNLSDYVEDAPVMVSTFHKTKGKEFDNVYILDDNLWLNDEQKRAMYVGLTRAKNNLIIHTVSNIFNYFKAENLVASINEVVYNKPERLIYQINHEDVALGYFKLVQNAIKKLKSGDTLTIIDDVMVKDERKILKLSKKYSDRVRELLDSGYSLTKAIVKFMVYWWDKEEEKDYLIVLPELTFDFNMNKEESPTESRE
ncbi:RecQ family ATP-dependent DNA helicase [Paracholeplasma manati]|uniref:DNA 3'-5' helicase n=1 Tax=Paracholeplasma manati TaxID=591373 RepID=A0ABT2Y5N3_9MOLU|nr:RecQ family ATP-dependent DNA helicase [Paracholeplasma manati]MCV2232059.1 RecQ family ATP-dependent DNA helicase [Paracholeplasma manati]MDG0887823.1 RecQ family ATP-dependent DNA helicase [Paracholeplasma manati]